MPLFQDAAIYAMPGRAAGEMFSSGVGGMLDRFYQGENARWMREERARKTAELAANKALADEIIKRHLPSEVQAGYLGRVLDPTSAMAVAGFYKNQQDLERKRKQEDEELSRREAEREGYRELIRATEPQPPAPPDGLGPGPETFRESREPAITAAKQKILASTSQPGQAIQNISETIYGTRKSEAALSAAEAAARTGAVQAAIAEKYGPKKAALEEKVGNLAYDKASEELALWRKWNEKTADLDYRTKTAQLGLIGAQAANVSRSGQVLMVDGEGNLTVESPKPGDKYPAGTLPAELFVRLETQAMAAEAALKTALEKNGLKDVKMADYARVNAAIREPYAATVEKLSKKMAKGDQTARTQLEELEKFFQDETIKTLNAGLQAGFGPGGANRGAAGAAAEPAFDFIPSPQGGAGGAAKSGYLTRPGGASAAPAGGVSQPTGAAPAALGQPTGMPEVGVQPIWGDLVNEIRKQGIRVQPRLLLAKPANYMEFASALQAIMEESDQDARKQINDIIGTLAERERGR